MTAIAGPRSGSSGHGQSSPGTANLRSSRGRARLGRTQGSSCRPSPADPYGRRPTSSSTLRARWYPSARRVRRRNGWSCRAHRFRGAPCSRPGSPRTAAGLSNRCRVPLPTRRCRRPSKANVAGLHPALPTNYGSGAVVMAYRSLSASHL